MKIRKVLICAKILLLCFGILAMYACSPSPKTKGEPETYSYFDSDGDGYGNPDPFYSYTSQDGYVPPGHVLNNTDCNDIDASVHPGATEICDAVDNDCNGQIDENGCSDDHGNSLSTATSLTVGTTVNGNIETIDDVDYFSFSATAGRGYNITFSGGTIGEAYVYLYDSLGNFLNFDSNDYYGNLTWICQQSGTYYVVISYGDYYGSDYSSLGTYTLLISCNSNCGNASTCAYVVSQPPQTSFSSAGGTGSISVTTQSGCYWQIGAINPNMTVPDWITFTPGRNFTGSNTVNYSVAALTTSETRQATIIIIGSSENSTQLYTITQSASSTSDSDDHGNTSATATFVNVGSTAQGNIEKIGDVDYFSFTAVAGKSYGIHAIEKTIGQTPDLYLYSTDGATLVDKDDSSGGEVSWTCSTSGTYYCKISNHSYSDYSYIGKYAFAVEELNAYYQSSNDYHADTPSAATHFSLGDAVYGVINTDTDIDYFKFNAIAGVTYKFKNKQRDSNLVIQLYSTDGYTPQIDGWSDGNWLCSASGMYYVTVNPKSYHPEPGKYILSIVGNNGNDDHGNTLATATSLPVNASVNGEIEMLGDIDYFKFTAIAGTTYKIGNFGTSTLNYVNNVQLTLYDTNGATINSDVSGSSDGTINIQWTCATSGTYYASISTYNTKGAYRLILLGNQ